MKGQRNCQAIRNSVKETASLLLKNKSYWPSDNDSITTSWSSKTSIVYHLRKLSFTRPSWVPFHPWLFWVRTDSSTTRSTPQVDNLTIQHVDVLNCTSRQLHNLSKSTTCMAFRTLHIKVRGAMQFPRWNARVLEMQNFTQAYTKGWTYVRMIFSQPKFSYPWCSAVRASREGSAIILFWHTHKDGPQILNIDSIVCFTLRMQITITSYLPSWHQVLAVPLAHRRTCSLRQPGLLQCCVSKCELCFFYGLFHVSGCLNNWSPQLKLVRHDTSILTAMCVFHLIGKCVNQI